MAASESSRSMRKRKHAPCEDAGSAEKAILKEITYCLKKPLDQRSESDEVLIRQHPDQVVRVQRRLEKNVRRRAREVEVEESDAVLAVKVSELAEVLRSAGQLVVYTGAGVSTAASIPDYRGPDGIWTRLSQGKHVGEHDLTAARPTYTHMALCALWRRGLLKHVVSQNCDGLHLRSGLPRRCMSEVHGNMYIEVCTSCPREYVRNFDVTSNTSRANHKTGRRCYECGTPLVDTVVHFGEKGRLKWPLNWSAAVKRARKSDVILCLGSSLKVLRKYSWLWCMHRPPERRPRLYIVNLQWTPKDHCATLKINARCDDVMSRLMRLLDIDVGPYSVSEDRLLQVVTPLHRSETAPPSRLSASSPPAVRPEATDKSQKKRLLSNGQTGLISQNTPLQLSDQRRNGWDGRRELKTDCCDGRMKDGLEGTIELEVECAKEMKNDKSWGQVKKMEEVLEDSDVKTECGFVRLSGDVVDKRVSSVVGVDHTSESTEVVSPPSLRFNPCLSSPERPLNGLHPVTDAQFSPRRCAESAGHYLQDDATASPMEYVIQTEDGDLDDGATVTELRNVLVQTDPIDWQEADFTIIESLHAPQQAASEDSVNAPHVLVYSSDSSCGFGTAGFCSSHIRLTERNGGSPFCVSGDCLNQLSSSDVIFIDTTSSTVINNGDDCCRLDARHLVNESDGCGSLRLAGDVQAAGEVPPDASNGSEEMDGDCCKSVSGLEEDVSGDDGAFSEQPDDECAEGLFPVEYECSGSAAVYDGGSVESTTTVPWDVPLLDDNSCSYEWTGDGESPSITSTSPKTTSATANRRPSRACVRAVSYCEPPSEHSSTSSSDYSDGDSSGLLGGSNDVCSSSSDDAAVCSDEDGQYQPYRAVFRVSRRLLRPVLSTETQGLSAAAGPGWYGKGCKSNRKRSRRRR